MSCELIYVYFNRIESLPCLHNQGFSLSNKYDIQVEVDEFEYCTSISISEKEDIYENIYSDVIKDINVIVGINGMGKTTLFDILGSTRNERKSKLLQWTFFLIYKTDDYFVIEGNNSDFIKEAIDNFSHPHGIHPEYSIKCSYNFEEKKFCFKNLCRESDRESVVNKILYYKDRSNNAFKWNNKDNSYEDAMDYNVFIERQIIAPSPLNICNYINSIYSDKNWGDFSLPKINAVLSIDGINRKKLFWNGFDEKFRKKTFLLQFLLNYASDNCHGLNDENLSSIKEIVNELEEKSYNKILEYKDIDEYISKVLKKYEGEKYIQIYNLVNMIQGLEDSFFSATTLKGIWSNLMPSCMSLIFNVTDLKYRELLETTDKIFGISNTLKIIYPRMSAGELKMIDIFSSIASFISDKGTHYIILLDEPEKSLHPEMSRRFICNLKTHAVMLAKVFNCTFQFLISTHTPFLISDVPKPHIHCLNKNQAGQYVIEKAKKGLMSNVHDIVKDTFFLDKPVGEFADVFFEEIIFEISNLNGENKDRIRKIIDDIDEPTIFTYLNKIYNEKIKKVLEDDDLIIYYEKQLEKLKEKK